MRLRCDSDLTGIDLESYFCFELFRCFKVLQSKGIALLRVDSGMYLSTRAQY